MRANLAKYSITFLAVACIFAGSLGAQGKASLTLRDYFDLESVSDAQIAPDGQKIIYVRGFSDVMTDKRYSNLWTINFDGTGNRPLTSGHYSDSSPRWSPDGSQLLFISNRDGQPQIYKRWMDSGQTVLLTNLQFPPSGISWSPDGKQIAFSSVVPGMPRSIVKLPPAPPGAKWAKPAIVIDKSFYRFDGMGYTVGMGYMHLFVIPAEGGTPRQLSKHSMVARQQEHHALRQPAR